MSIFVSTTQQDRHGVFAIEKTSQPQITAQGTAVAAIVGQPGWGPPNTLMTPASPKDLLDMVAPPGIDRTNSFYLSVIRKSFPLLKFVRVMGTGAVAASAAFPDLTAVAVINVAVKYPGTEGNRFVGVVSDASDGVADHFNLTVSTSMASGTTSETWQNLNYKGNGTTVGDSVPSLTNSLLVGAITKVMAAGGRPVNGTVSFTGGTTPEVTADDYVGTEGTGDKGIALLEGDSTVRHVFADDMGATDRAAVNEGLVAHGEYMGDRMVYLNGVSGQSLSQVKTDVALYRSDRAYYCDPWVYVTDAEGTMRLTPSAAFAASVGAQLSPSTSIGWKNQEVQKMLSGISALEQDRGQGAGQNTKSGVVTFLREDSGGFTMEADVTTLAPVDETRAHGTRRRMTDYIALAFVLSTRGFVDAPNVFQNQQLLVNGLIALMDNLKANQNRDANHTPHVLDYAIGDLGAENSATTLAQGLFSIPLIVKISSGMYRIILNINSGEGVSVREAA
jgi:hypothetical protein